jgi:hypothetical protein
MHGPPSLLLLVSSGQVVSCDQGRATQVGPGQGGAGKVRRRHQRRRRVSPTHLGTRQPGAGQVGILDVTTRKVDPG